MSIKITVIHQNKRHEINLAQAADLIGMAKSTFSAHWRRRVSDDDQESFDQIISCRRIYSPRACKRKLRTKQAIERSEIVAISSNRSVIDRFLLGVA